jgi:hypothetical protein
MRACLRQWEHAQVAPYVVRKDLWRLTQWHMAHRTWHTAQGTQHMAHKSLSIPRQFGRTITVFTSYWFQMSFEVRLKMEWEKVANFSWAPKNEMTLELKFWSAQSSIRIHKHFKAMHLSLRNVKCSNQGEGGKRTRLRDRRTWLSHRDQKRSMNLSDITPSTVYSKGNRLDSEAACRSDLIPPLIDQGDSSRYQEKTQTHYWAPPLSK